MILSFELLASQLEDNATRIEVLDDFLQGLKVDSALLGLKSLNQYWVFLSLSPISVLLNS